MPIEGVLEKIYAPMFDTIFLPQGLRQNRGLLFSLPLGSMAYRKNGWLPKSETETNLFNAGMLDAPRQMTVESIDCHFVDEEGIVPARSRWYAETTIEFQLQCKSYWTSPASKCVSTAALIDAQVDLEKQPLITAEEIAKLKELYQNRIDPPVHIDQCANFAVRVSFSEWCDWSRRSAPEKLVVYLNGQQLRAVL